MYDEVTKATQKREQLGEEANSFDELQRSRAEYLSYIENITSRLRRYLSKKQKNCMFKPT